MQNPFNIADHESKDNINSRFFGELILAHSMHGLVLTFISGVDKLRDPRNIDR
jgi:hypothetical protein